MALQFVTKRFRKRPIYNIPSNTIVVEDEIKLEAPQIEEVKEDENKNNKKNSKKDMINKEQISDIEAAMKNLQPEIKKVKKDKGLIERTESSKIIITEDNRQVLND